MCERKITGEHFIPESVLALFGPHVRVAGMVFPETLVSVANLKAKILCKRHNELLSPLDEVAKGWFGVLMRHVRVLASGLAATSGSLLLVNGDDIEQVLLKMLCGLTASGALPRVRKTAMDPCWFNILFGQDRWCSGWGMYVEHGQPGIHEDNFDGFTIGLRVDAEGVPYQMGVTLGPWHLVLHVGDDSSKPNLSNYHFRPTLLVAERGAARNGIVLTYSAPGAGGFVRTTIHQ